MNGRADERTDRPYFIGPFKLLPVVQKMELLNVNYIFHDPSVNPHAHLLLDAFGTGNSVCKKP